MTEMAVHCTDLTKSFRGTLAVQRVSLELSRGRSLALLGPSGCGKTTLLRLIAGFEAPDEGSVEVGGRLVAGPGRFVPPEKRRVGMVFQDYALFPHLDVARNIAYGLASNSSRKDRVREMLSLVGLAGLESRMPHELSGGEQQRVALARALAPAPEVLLLDEPFSNLDADLRGRIRTEVKDILACAGATVIFVTHDQEEALFMGDRVGVMNKGRLEQVDAPEALFYRPATSFVAQFVGTADFVEGSVRGALVDTEVGPLPLARTPSNGRAAKVLLRPDMVEIQPSPEGTGVVVERVFLGSHCLYRVRLPSGATLRSLQHHSHTYPLGTQVAVRVNGGQSVVCFPNGVERHDLSPA